MEYPEFGCECVVFDEAVHHFHAFGLHGVLLAELVLRDVLVVEVADFTHPLIINYTTHTAIKNTKNNIKYI